MIEHQTKVQKDLVKKLQEENRFFRIAIFADLITRYMDIEYKDSVNWLKTFLLFIRINRGESITVNELGRIMLRQRNNMTILINKLEKEGLVKRYRSDIDHRKVHLEVTQAGYEYMLQRLKDIDKAERKIESFLDEGELKTFLKLIIKMRDRLITGVSDKI